MGCFEDRARRVRDSGLVHGQRVAALCSCVRWYHPIGHRATLASGHWYETRPNISRRAALHALKLWERSLMEGIRGSRDPGNQSQC